MEFVLIMFLLQLSPSLCVRHAGSDSPPQTVTVTYKTVACQPDDDHDAEPQAVCCVVLLGKRACAFDFPRSATRLFAHLVYLC